LRVVLDANVLISAVLTPAGPPAELLRRWRAGEFDLLVSELLLGEVERILLSSKLAPRVATNVAPEFIALLRAEAELVRDAEAPPPVRSEDPGDDNLIALAESEEAALVSGDGHLLELASRAPVYSPREFLERL